MDNKIIRSPEMVKRAAVNRYIRLSETLQVTYDKFRADPIPCLQAQAKELERLRGVIAAIREALHPTPKFTEWKTVVYEEPADIMAEVVRRVAEVERILQVEAETAPAKIEP